jgi:hypothetical protein
MKGWLRCWPVTDGFRVFIWPPIWRSFSVQSELTTVFLSSQKTLPRQSVRTLSETQQCWRRPSEAGSMEQQSILHDFVPVFRRFVLDFLILERRSSGTPNVIARRGTINMRRYLPQHCHDRPLHDEIWGKMRYYPGEIPIGWVT